MWPLVDLFYLVQSGKASECLTAFLSLDKPPAEKWPTLSLLWPSIVSLSHKCEPSSAEDLFQGEQSEDERTSGEDNSNYSQATEDIKAAVLSAISNKIDKKPIDPKAKEKAKKE